MYGGGCEELKSFESLHFRVGSFSYELILIVSNSL